MKMYEVFKSEGGYRYAGEICLGGPVISNSPWFKSMEDAIDAANNAKADDMADSERMAAMYGIE